MADLVAFLAKAYVERKDPLLKKEKNALSETPVALSKVGSESEPTFSRPKRTMILRKPIGTKVKREIFQRDQFCQWKDSKTNQICGSKFRLEIDHKKSVWAGGENDIENLQLLCRPHNVLKYKREIV